MENKKIRWGLLGAGFLLERWLRGAAEVEEAEIAAVASRTRETAERQAEKYGIPEAMTYDEMLARDDFDILYIPVPHNAHKELAIRAMEAGFPVLVEKPAAVTCADWDEMTACAKKNHVFLMEAVWMRCFPAARRLLEELRAGRIGQIRNLQSTFAFRTADDYEGRLTDPERAGGALLDVGVYNLHFMQMVTEKNPEKLVSLASMDTDDLHIKVDEQYAVIGQYDDGTLAVANGAIRTEMPDTAAVYGTKGWIDLPDFWRPKELLIHDENGVEHVEIPVPHERAWAEDEGYQYEISHVHDCLRQGLLESPYVPQRVTHDVLTVCDTLRAQWGLVYPFEKN